MNWHEVPRRLQVRYLHAAAITVAQLERVAGELEQDCRNRDALKLMLRRFQGLAAWAGLHGLATISVAAQLGEHDCATLVGAAVVPEPAHLEQLRSLIRILRHEIYRQRTTGGIAEEILWARSAPREADSPAPAAPQPRYRALAVGLGEVDWQQLETALLRQGFALQAVETCREAGRVLATDPPQAVIAAADLPDGSGTLLTHFLRSLERGDEPVVVLVGSLPAAGSAALATSAALAVAEPLPGCDADAQFDAPVDWTPLAERLAALLERRRSAPRVLVVESDGEHAGGIGALLRAAGYRVRRCRDPRRFGHEVSTCEPDLVLIDVLPASETAGELMHWLRSDKRYATVPVILLAAEDDGEAQPLPCLGAGAERVAKPVTAAELLFKVAARIQRCRALELLFAQIGHRAQDPAPRPAARRAPAVSA
jgi:DNA-binding response OmpR family regulator